MALLIIVSALIDSINNSNLINTGLEDDLQFTFKWPGDLFNFEDVQLFHFIYLTTIQFVEFFN